MSIIVSGQTVIYDTIRYAKEHHEERLNVFKNESSVKGGIVFLGDSITEFGNWQELLNDLTVVNRGIAGDNTFGMLSRLDEIVKREPKKLFIKIGINDISQNIPIQIIVRNMGKILERIKLSSPNTKIYLQSVLPTNENAKNSFPDAFNKNNIVNSLNKEFKTLASRFKTVYVDINKIFSDKEGKLDKKIADSDGLHLNNIGYKTWVDYLKKRKYL